MSGEFLHKVQPAMKSSHPSTLSAVTLGIEEDDVLLDPSAVCGTSGASADYRMIMCHPRKNIE